MKKVIFAQSALLLFAAIVSQRQDGSADGRLAEAGLQLPGRRLVARERYSRCPRRLPADGDAATASGATTRAIRFPPGAPLALDKANFADPGADARHLGARGQEARRGRDATAGLAHARRRGARAVPLGARRAASTRQPPGRTAPARYVLHRLNRTGIRQRGSRSARRHHRRRRICCRATAATSDSTTSRRRSRRRRCCSSAISRPACGSPSSLSAMPAPSRAPTPTRSAPSSRRTQHVEGLPLGTRGGMLVRHTFPADGEYVFSGRLLKTVAEGLVGCRGARDAASVHRHHRRQAACSRRRSAARRITSRRPRTSRSTARRVRQADDVAAHQGDRRSARGGLHVRRAAGAGTEHVAAGAARHARKRTTRRACRGCATAIIEGPYAVTGVSAARRRGRGCSSARRDRGAGSAVRRRRSCLDRGAPRVPPAGRRSRPGRADGALHEERTAGGDFDAGIRAGLAQDSHQSLVPLPLGKRSSGARVGHAASRQPSSSWRAGCRSSCGAASRMTSC